MTTTTDIQKILQNKKNDNDDVYEYNLTPEYDDDAWCDAIMEARGSGVPHASFCDTKDKFVLTPEHLGYEEFVYYWLNGWADYDCWTALDMKANNSTIVQANKDLVEVGKKLLPFAKVVVCFPSGSGKGYISCILKLLDSDSSYESIQEDFRDDMVLFVYAKLDKLIEQVEQEQKGCDEKK